MRIFLVLPAVFLFAAPLMAQQPENAPASELSKLRQGYVDSLHHLLQQYVKDDDVAAAATVSQELDRMAAITPDAPPDLSPCGAWRWPFGGVITITADGITTNTSWKTKGIWHWVNESKHQFRIKWQDGFLDKATVSPDGMKLQLSNNHGDHWMADRLPPSERNTAEK